MTASLRARPVSKPAVDQDGARHATCGDRRRSVRHDPASTIDSVPDTRTKEDVMGRGILLWLLGIPIPVIILIALLT